MIGRLRRITGFLALVLSSALTGCSGAGGGSSSTPTQNLVAAANGPYYGAPGTPLTVAGGVASAPDGPGITYAYTWTFGDGGTGNNLVAQHTYAMAGVYTATLTATDSIGQSSSSPATIHIAVTPIANPGGPYTAYVGTPLTFNGAASSDAQGSALTYYWDFGDKTTGTGVAPTHTYSSTGAFNAYLVVTDAFGLSSKASYFPVSAGLPPPTVIINGPYTGRPALPVVFHSQVSDAYADNFTYLWSFGDGVTSTAVNPTHAYATPGAYTVQLVVTGSYFESTTVTSTATITAGDGTGPPLSGIVQSGSTPVAGAHVYLFAANTTGYGQPSISLLTGTGLTDAFGGYVLSNGNGAFALPAGYACSTHSQIYLYATGGTVGSNSNLGAGLLSALGACGYLSSGSAITVNEATTVAAAYAMAGYAVDPLHVSSPNTTAAITGIGNAFLNAANLASAATGQAILTTAAGNGAAPQATVNTLASILNACVVAPASSSTCTSLYVNAESAAGATPADTATAAINIAHNVGANVPALYALLPANRAFVPTLTAAPHSWAMGVTYTGMPGAGAHGLALDSGGNVWVLQEPRYTGTYPYLTELTSNGTVQTGLDVPCLQGTEPLPESIAIDPANNIWILSASGAGYIDLNGDEQTYYTTEYCTVSNAGVMLSPPGGYYLGGSPTASFATASITIDGAGNGYFPSTTLIGRTLNDASAGLNGAIFGNSPYVFTVALDGLGNVWGSSQSTNGIIELSKTGNLISPPNGYTGGGLDLPFLVAIDHAGNVWTTNSKGTALSTAGPAVSKFSNSGVPLTSSTTPNPTTVIPYSMAIDGAGNAWLAARDESIADSTVVELAPDASYGMYLSHAFYGADNLTGPQSIAVDSAGSVWVSNGMNGTIYESAVTQFIGAATPVVTPLAASLNAPYNAPASKP